MAEPCVPARPVYDRHGVTVWSGDCLDVLRTLPDASVHAVVCDPPYGLAEHKPATVAAALAAWTSGDRTHVPDQAGFMGKGWDGFVPPPAVWDECLRVLKPGGHLAAFAGSRTVDLMTLSVRLAGFEIRDGLTWLYGSGFPKSLDVSKAIDQARDDRTDILRVTGWLAEQRDRAGWTNRRIDEALGLNGMAGHWTAGAHMKIAQVPRWEQWQQLRDLIGFGDDMDAEVCRLNGRKGTPGEAWETAEVLRTETRAHAPSGLVGVGQAHRNPHGTRAIKAPGTDAARQWQGFGTALKPAWEPIVLARKPLAGTVAATVLAHGTGALNIDACRIGDGARTNRAGGSSSLQRMSRVAHGYREHVTTSTGEPSVVMGRWPTNAVFVHHPGCGPDEQPGPCVDGCPVAELDRQSGTLTSGKVGSDGFVGPHTAEVYGRFARNELRPETVYGDSGGASRFFPVFRWEAKAPTSERPQVAGVAHPTVKPVGLMRWLVRLLCPPGGTIIDPFAGTGTTGQAARAEGMRALLIEREDAYLPLIVARLDARARTPAPAASGDLPDGEPLDLLDLLDQPPREAS